MNLQSLGMSPALLVAHPTGASSRAKTASVDAPAGGAADAAITAAVTSALQTIGSPLAKMAAEVASPTSDLEKMAADAAARASDAHVVHGAQVGTAMADAFMLRLDQYKTAAQTQTAKLAADLGVTAEELAMVKLAREDPETFLAQVQAGYAAGTKEAEAAGGAKYVEDYNQFVRGVHKTASDHWVAGYTALDAALAAPAAQ